MVVKYRMQSSTSHSGGKGPPGVGHGELATGASDFAPTENSHTRALANSRPWKYFWAYRRAVAADTGNHSPVGACAFPSR